MSVNRGNAIPHQEPKNLNREVSREEGAPLRLEPNSGISDAEAAALRALSSIGAEAANPQGVLESWPRTVYPKSSSQTGEASDCPVAQRQVAVNHLNHSMDSIDDDEDEDEYIEVARSLLFSNDDRGVTPMDRGLPSFTFQGNTGDLDESSPLPVAQGREEESETKNESPEKWHRSRPPPFT